MNRKVGIMTFHESQNYGTVLQAFALQEIIKSLGFEPEIINYQRNREVLNNKTNIFKRITSGITAYFGLKIIYYPMIKKFSKSKTYKFSLFRSKYLSYSSAIYTIYSDLEKCHSQYSAYVCGSDMIWSVDRSENVGIYFLNFAPKEKRIAYAPSFGSNIISKDLISTYKKYLNEIKYLSCREISGVNLIKKLTNRDAHLVVDPTMLIDKDRWKEKFPFMGGISKPYILCYLFGGVRKEVQPILNYIKNTLGLAVRFIPMSVNDFTFNKENNGSGIGPIEFVELFSEAEFIITNSYHGLLFSLIFNKSFFIIKRNRQSHWAQFEDRFESLLNTLGLIDRLIDPKTDISKMSLLIDYSNVNKIIEKLRFDSLEFLKNSIENVMRDENENQ